MTHEELMREALSEAQLAFDEGEIPVGAVIVLEGEIIARAHNLREQTGDPTAHAEVLAIRAAAQALGVEAPIFPRTTMLGAMSHYVANGSNGDFVPMNANFGIIEPLGYRVKGGKVAKNQALAERALSIIDEMKNNF